MDLVSILTRANGGPRALVQSLPTARVQDDCQARKKHLAGVYVTNAGGESEPTLYIFDSGAKIEATTIV